jgi:hypothetical protein
MIGMIAMYTNGHPWPGGAGIHFDQHEVHAVGSISAYNDFVKRHLVRLADDRVVFVKLKEQSDADRKWLNGVARALRSELRARAYDGTLVIPTREIGFIIHWKDIVAGTAKKPG